MTATITSARTELLTNRLHDLLAERDQAKLDLIAPTSGDIVDRATNVDVNIRFAVLEQHILEIELELAEQPPVHQADGTVAIGDVVTLDLGEGPERFLVGNVVESGFDMEVLTPSSPLGRVVVGARAGETVSYQPRPGRTMLATIVSVE